MNILLTKQRLQLKRKARFTNQTSAARLVEYCANNAKIELNKLNKWCNFIAPEFLLQLCLESGFTMNLHSSLKCKYKEREHPQPQQTFSPEVNTIWMNVASHISRSVHASSFKFSLPPVCYRCHPSLLHVFHSQYLMVLSDASRSEGPLIPLGSKNIQIWSAGATGAS